jgi:hypothetical protein
MTLRGNVRDFPLRAVLEMLGQTKKTGELQVRVDDRVGALGIADGRVVTAVFNEEEPLLALGAIFALDGAEFEFTPWDDAPPANLEGKTLADLLRQADVAKKQAEEARRKAEEEREAARKKAEEEAEAERKRIEELRALIPRDDVAFRLSERAVDQGAVTLTSERWRVVLAVNGERDLSAIASMLHLDHNAALTALAGLVRDGVIEGVSPTAYEAPAYDSPAASAPTFEPSPTYESAARAYEPSEPYTPEAPPVESSENAFAPAPEETNQFMPQPQAPAAETPLPQDWITPDHVAPEPDWTTASPTETAPVSEVAPQWGPVPEAPVPPPDWVTPDVVEPSLAADDRLSALSGIFGPPPAEPKAPAAQPPTNSWAPPAATSDGWGTPAQPAPTAERWSAPAREPATPATSDDPWGVAPSTAPPQSEPWTPSAPDKGGEPDAWVPPAQSQSTWSAPAASPASADPWGSPARLDPRISALSIPEPGTPPVEEWSPPPAVPGEKKKRGLFGFGRDKPAPPVAGMPLPTADVVGSRVGMLAALANTLIAEYNNGQYGKGRIEERIANLLMRVDEQADPIDRPLPIVDDRIDVEALEREHVADSQALPYLALLVTTIFTDAEKAFGKDKAKKGYKAAQKSVLLGDASALNSPELAGKLPRV